MFLHSGPKKGQKATFSCFKKLRMQISEFSEQNDVLELVRQKKFAMAADIRQDGVGCCIMPIRAKRPCTTVGCGAYAFRNGKCKRHARMVDQQRGLAHTRGYGALWGKIRQTVLNDEPLCRRCRATGVIKEADLVHHIDRNSSNNDRSNLEPLCRSCHADEHAAEYILS